ncbi:MAG: hypothetical protein JNK84_15035 [Phreatobacter sp.]|uniref:DUF1127 domain-containing protein n=1 Tax=Phreatobacter sp. TaxID=1966341 RepID=UPI001A4864D6|nr:hypothetical protein [Phreatobacter sp.]MBL8570382.1 hypothetical protein [Phreatobacter sp.]
MTHATPRLRRHVTPFRLARLPAIWRLWRMRSETRPPLAELDRDGLADIGLTDFARRRECARWFWQ